MCRIFAIFIYTLTLFLGTFTTTFAADISNGLNHKYFNVELKSKALPTTMLKNNCIPLELKTACAKKSICSVNSLKALGNVESTPLYAGLYHYQNSCEDIHNPNKPMLNNTVAVILAEKSKGELTPLAAHHCEGNLCWHEEPQLINHQDNKLLIIPTKEVGTGHMRHYALYEYRTDKWQPIKTHNFFDALNRRLPAGVELWKGPELDFKSWSLSTRVWKKDDSHCCPTGGHLKATFEIRNNTLSITNSQHSPATYKKGDKNDEGASQ